MNEAPPFDMQAFRKALSCFPTGVAIMTTRGADGQPVGLTCSSFNSVSLDPPLVLWSLRNESRSFAAFEAADAFAVNVLAEDQTELSSRFASSTRTDKFSDVAWQPGALDTPLLAGCVARFECRKWAHYPAGDHAIFIGQVHGLDVGRPESSLVFYKGSYMELARSLRELASEDRLSPRQLQEAVSVVFGSVARLGCVRGSEEDFQAIAHHLHVMELLVRPEDVDARNRAGMDFFELVARTAHNEALERVAGTLNALLRHVFLADRPARFRPELVPLRWQVLQHLRARDGDGAAAAIEAYLQTRLPELRAA